MSFTSPTLAAGVEQLARYWMWAVQLRELRLLWRQPAQCHLLLLSVWHSVSRMRIVCSTTRFLCLHGTSAIAYLKQGITSYDLIKS